MVAAVGDNTGLDRGYRLHAAFLDQLIAFQHYTGGCRADYQAVAAIVKRQSGFADVSVRSSCSHSEKSRAYPWEKRFARSIIRCYHYDALGLASAYPVSGHKNSLSSACTRRIHMSGRALSFDELSQLAVRHSDHLQEKIPVERVK